MNRPQPRIPTASALGVHQSLGLYSILGKSEEAKSKVEFLKKAKSIVETLDIRNLTYSLNNMKRALEEMENTMQEFKNLQDSVSDSLKTEN